jgi:hypothetical protein
MVNDVNKKVLLSGKLNGTRSLENTLKSISNPDEIEQFLIEFLDIKLDFDLSNSITYINDNSEFETHIGFIEKSQFISFHPTPNFTRLYVTTDNKKTYIIRLNKVSSGLIADLVAKDDSIKFALNSFSFIKWCNSQKIDMRNIFDIPTYIKLLTNNIDPFKTINEYIKQYSNYELSEDDNETNSIIIGNFIYEFGKYLNTYIEKFNLQSVNKLINENSSYEGSTFDNVGNCSIIVKYKNIMSVVSTIASEKIKDFENKEYVLSPLFRIALKYDKKVSELLEELYYEDLSIIVLNELYNNNIPVELLEDNSFKIECKYKNFNNVVNVLTAILNNVFYTLLDQSVVIGMECEIKE